MTQDIPNVRQRQSGPKSDRAHEGHAVPYSDFYFPSTMCVCIICLHIRVKPDTLAQLIVAASPFTENLDKNAAWLTRQHPTVENHLSVYLKVPGIYFFMF
jgi:hypothetical protein